MADCLLVSEGGGLGGKNRHEEGGSATGVKHLIIYDHSVSNLWGRGKECCQRPEEEGRKILFLK